MTPLDSPPDLIAQFHTALNDAAAVFGIARSALPRTAELLERAVVQTALGDDELVHLTVPSGSIAEGSSASFAAWKAGDIKENLSGRGQVALQIGHQWVTHVYHLWENDFRPRIARAHGLDYDPKNSPRTELVNPYMADLAKIRHDVLKNRGIASRQNCGRCEDLQWFNVGESILITEQHVFEFMEGFGLAYSDTSTSALTPAKYRFHGIFDSPARVFFYLDPNLGELLVAESRSTDGLPVNHNQIKAGFVGREFPLRGRGRVVTAEVVSVGGVPYDPAVLLIGMRCDKQFREEVRTGATALELQLGSAVPIATTRRAVPVRWVRGDLVIVSVTAPPGQRFDHGPFSKLIDTERTLVSTYGDLYRSTLVGVQYGPGDELRTLQIYLRVSGDVSRSVKNGTLQLRLPFLFPDVDTARAWDASRRKGKSSPVSE